MDSSELFSYKEHDCVLAIDYGMTSCHSVITIVAEINTTIKLLLQHSFPLGSDDALIIPMVKDLMGRFRIVKFIGDDCPQGYRTNRELEGLGEFERFNFRSDSAAAERNRGYFTFRAALYQGRIKYPNIPELIIELKGLQEETLKITTNIAKPNGGFDDRADSFMMACFPFLREGVESFDSEVIGKTNSMIINRNIKSDGQWDSLSTGFNEEDVRIAVQKRNDENRRKYGG